ncbi:hypothetical protein [endosymbiont GvMRE of Glomus versiforme]|uniref:hypothetical protein n=1 Tax=endosymbiont GvMRE of Glomus versiforme TaxID=2039283 RepID=UPI000ED9BB81|nr:hypothetical protein [endosymbiont GvMRE of Glomus versiforme]RHZ36533.1 hypothetical protein GvMRE_I2g222 [endosymbiont GvMRE of Glomus versiforme]
MHKNNKKTKEKLKGLNNFQVQEKTIYFPDASDYSYPGKKTNSQKSLILVIAGVICCILLFLLLQKKVKKNRTRSKKFIPIIVKIVNSTPSLRNGKRYYFFVWENSLEYTGWSSSCFIVNEDHPVIKEMGGIPQTDQRYFLGINSWGKVINECGINSHYFENNNNIKLLGMQCFFCSSIDFDDKKKSLMQCWCSCRRDNFSKKCICLGKYNK